MSKITRRVLDLVKAYRTFLRLDPRWNIQVKLEKLEDAWGEIDFLSEGWTAYISIDSDRTDDELELTNTIVHELLELATWETYEIIERVLDQDETDSAIYSDSIKQIYKAARNRFIETMIPIVIAAKEHQDAQGHSRRSTARASRPSRDSQPVRTNGGVQ
jgi:hypothetical protein